MAPTSPWTTSALITSPSCPGPSTQMSPSLGLFRVSLLPTWHLHPTPARCSFQKLEPYPDLLSPPALAATWTLPAPTLLPSSSFPCLYLQTCYGDPLNIPHHREKTQVPSKNDLAPAPYHTSWPHWPPFCPSRGQTQTCHRTFAPASAWDALPPDLPMASLPRL